MGHQDNDLELRALFAEATTEPEPAPIEKMPEPEARHDDTPLALDHDAVPSWRETARFFRKAA